VDLGSLFARAGEALRERARAVALDLDEAGEPFAERVLAQLAALLRDQVPRAAERCAPRLDVPVGGAGTYADPWTLPLRGERAELLAWLEPAGPPPDWAAALAARVGRVADAPTLVAQLERLPSFVPGLPRWMAPDVQGPGLAALGAWLAGGDGASPLAAQLPGLPGWLEGAPLASPHDAQPRDPAAIAQIAAQLDAWADPDGGRAVILLGPAWTDHGIWSDLLAALGPDRPAGAHFDLRGGAAAASVTAVARHYTADLADPGDGDHAALAAQIGAAVDQVIDLTGRERVVLVAHSTAGLAARVLAGDRADVVRGLVTLGTPHGGVAPAPLTDPLLAEAVRAARGIAGATADGTIAGTMLARLDGGLDGVPGAFRAGAFAPVPDGIPNHVPALALGSAVGGDLVRTLAALLADRVAAAAAAASAADAPTHLGLGVRCRLPLPAAPPGDVALEGAVRIDAARLRLVNGAAPPARPARAATIRLEAFRPGGWLAGDAIGGPRIRSAELAVVVVPSDGTIAASPSLVLRDVTLGGFARRDVTLGEAGLAPALDALGDALGAPAAGTPAALLADLGVAAGVLRRTPGGALRADAAGLGALATAPTATLRARRDALLDELEAALGGALAAVAPGVALELSLDRPTWTLRLRSTADLALGEGVAAGLDGALALATLAPSLQAELRAGAVRLRHDAAGTLTLSAPPWLAPLALRPPPAPAALREALLPLVPRLALSAALSAALGELLEAPRSVGALDRVLADPGGVLSRLAGDDIQALLRGAAGVLGLDPTHGLPLPGGFLLRASGAAAIDLELAGTLALGAANDELRLGLTLHVDASRAVALGGSLELDVGLPGTWARLAAEFTVTPAGVALAVTPEGAPPIALLPRFSGFGDLAAAGAASLLPHLLQAVVDELRPAVGPPDGLLGGALALATALGVYGDDAQGFEEPQRAARLAAMLQPGWLATQAGNASNLAQLTAALFGPGLLQPPAGAVARNQDRVSWTAPLPGGAGGTVVAEVKLGAPPAVAIEVQGLGAGPLVVETARFGSTARRHSPSRCGSRRGPSCRSCGQPASWASAPAGSAPRCCRSDRPAAPT
jgi:pimeloyl-ACP methyl ester carboxylesterase